MLIILKKGTNMRKMTYILLPLFLLVGLFIPISCEDAADDLADALAGGGAATLFGTWSATEMRQYEGENCDSLTRTRAVNVSMTFSQNNVAYDMSLEMDAAGFCTDFYSGSVDGTTCTRAAECDCDDADGDCDDNVTTESECTAGGGDWDEEETLDMTSTDYLAFLEMMCSDGDAPCGGGTWNSATNTCSLCQELMNVELEIIDDTSFKTTEYDCDCEDSNGNDIEGCDDDDIATESACTTAGGVWEADSNMVQYEISGNTLTLTEKHVHNDGVNDITECIIWELTKD